MEVLNNIDVYQQFGDIRPSKDQLESFLEGTGGEPSSHRCDLFLDLAAADPDSTSHWLERAQKAVEELATSWRLTSNRQAYRVDALGAYLRQPELPNWKNALQAKPLENNYEGLLEAGFDIVTLRDQSFDPTFDHKESHRLVYFIPLLLGARALTRNSGGGWLGRLSLVREKHRSNLKDNANPNWATGITRDDAPETWLEPPTKLAIKPYLLADPARPHQSADAYRRAGVVGVSSCAVGFDNPWNIVRSCINETDPLPRILLDEDQPLLSSTELDQLTIRLNNEIMQGGTPSSDGA